MAEKFLTGFLLSLAIFFALIFPGQSFSVSISASTSTVAFGIIGTNETTSTASNPIVISVDEGPADLEISTTLFSDGQGDSWTFGIENGTNQVVWQFSSSTESWTTFENADYFYPFDSNVPQGETRNLYLRLITPTSVSSETEHQATLTIQAVAP